VFDRFRSIIVNSNYLVVRGIHIHTKLLDKIPAQATIIVN
jgi:hypothetical protein